jgi:diacylglycerol O-acyltransferase
MWDRRAVDAEPWFERIGPSDAQQLATDVGPVPANVGAVLVIDPPGQLEVADLVSVVTARAGAIPRMRQRLMSTPVGCGRPVWVDDPHFEASRHVEAVTCPPPADEAALMASAVAAVNRPLDRSRPLWRARIITNLADGRIGLVLVLHHVLADGVGGLAVLAELVDGGRASVAPSETPPSPTSHQAPAHGPRWNPTSASTPTPRPAPTAAALFADAARSRWRALRRTPEAAARLGPALTELGRDRPAPAPRCSLNTPTGPDRNVTVISTGLVALRRAGRAHGVTVNDLLLVAAARALSTVLAHRGERVAELVVSVPVSARPQATTQRLGNEVGVMSVRVPVGGSPHAALARVARATGARKSAQRGASAGLVAPAFRLLAALGLFGPMINRQRLVNSFLTNMRGPDEPMTLAGAPISSIAPVTIATGNVSVAFAALSYAGTLAVSVIVDPDVVPERDLLATALQHELEALTHKDPAG